MQLPIRTNNTNANRNRISGYIRIQTDTAFLFKIYPSLWCHTWYLGVTLPATTPRGGELASHL